MNNYFKLPTEDKRMVLQQTAANYGLPPQAIEKDIWVTTILQIVFSLPIAESLISAISGGIMLAATIVLFIMGFCFNNWELCWIGYPIGAVLIAIIVCISNAVKK